MFHGMGEFGGKLVLWQQITAFWKREILVRDFFREQKDIFRKPSLRTSREVLHRWIFRDTSPTPPLHIFPYHSDFQAGESGIPGKLVGTIDMYDKYTFVEVPRENAADVLRAMKNTKIKGKTINVEPANGR